MYSDKHQDPMKTRYIEKSIPMTVLWCPDFSNHEFMANFIVPETHQPIIHVVIIVDYLVCL